jgi:hypothetical protein
MVRRPVFGTDKAYSDNVSDRCETIVTKAWGMTSELEVQHHNGKSPNSPVAIAMNL